MASPSGGAAGHPGANFERSGAGSLETKSFSSPYVMGETMMQKGATSMTSCSSSATISSSSGGAFRRSKRPPSTLIILRDFAAPHGAAPTTGPCPEGGTLGPGPGGGPAAGGGAGGSAAGGD